MTFLNPAYLFGLLAAGIPIIIHFLNLRRMKEVEFSSLKFLKEIQKTKIRNIKIKQWLLLLVRVLIIVFIVLAFARPTLKDEFFIGGSANEKISAIVIIDNSISMSAKINSVTNFLQAKTAAKRYLSLLKNKDEISIISSSMESKNIKLKNIAEAEKEIDNIKISYTSHDISDAFQEAVEILNSSSGFNKEILILSDFQKSMTFAHFKNNSGYKVDERIKIFVRNFGKNGFNNMAITNLQLANQLLEKGMNIQLNSSLSNSAEKKVSENVISLFINNERVSQKSFSIGPKQSMNLNLETDLKNNGLSEAFAEIDDDEITYDNKYFQSFLTPEKINVIGISEETGELEFISLAVKSVENINLRIIPINKIASVNFNTTSLLIISVPNNDNKIDELTNLLPKNKNMLILPGANNSESNMSRFLKRMNLGSADFFQFSNPIEFEFIDFSHPILGNLFENKNISKIESPKVYKEFRLNISEPYRQIISLQNQSSFLSEKLLRNKKYLIFSTAFNEKFSDFQLKGIFAPIIVKIIYYLSIEYSESVHKVPGEIITFDLSDFNSNTIEVTKPDGEIEYLPVNNVNRFNYSKTNQVGTYKFLSDGKLIHYEDINVNPLEFNYDFYNSKDVVSRMKLLEINNKIFITDKKNNLPKLITQSRVGTELWRVLIFIVLFLVIAEMILAKNSRKDLAKVNQ